MSSSTTLEMRLAGIAAFSAEFIESWKTVRNCESEVWYITFTADISAMRK